MKQVLRAEVRNEAQLEQALASNAFEYIYVPIKVLRDVTVSDTDRIVVLPPVFLGDSEAEVCDALKALYQKGYRRVLAHTLAHIQLAEDAGMIVHGGFRLNITNSLSLHEYEQLGLADIICSIELTLQRAKKLRHSVPLGGVVYGRLPLMTVRRCPITDGELCGKGGCGERIVDRMGKELPLFCDTAVEIMNPDVLAMSDRLDELNMFDFLLLCFTDEENIGEITRRFTTGRKLDGVLTRGMYYRGVQ